MVSAGCTFCWREKERKSCVCAIADTGSADACAGAFYFSSQCGSYLGMLHTYNLETLATISKRWRKFRRWLQKLPLCEHFSFSFSSSSSSSSSLSSSFSVVLQQCDFPSSSGTVSRWVIWTRMLLVLWCTKQKERARRSIQVCKLIAPQCVMP